MARWKDIEWNLNGEEGQKKVTHDRIKIAVLMDIRDELKEANRHLSGIARQILCRNATAIPRILRKIEENTQRKSRTKKVP